jgi:hypothetical protein
MRGKGGAECGPVEKLRIEGTTTSVVQSKGAHKD